MADHLEHGAYRYTLHRSVSPLIHRGTLLWIMLNPSTADEHEDDPTITRCIGFTRRLGYADMRVINLYALRATDPTTLTLAIDPVGPSNDAVLRDWITAAKPPDAVMCAWGGKGDPARAEHVMALLREHCNPAVQVLALKLNADGSPGHPLYLRADTQPVPFPLDRKVTADA